MTAALYAIGDVHGCRTALETLLEAVAPTPHDTLVMLGDYVDRGPDTRGVIELLRQYQQTHRVVTLRGNHEAMMLNARHQRPELLRWLRVGGEAVLDAYDISDGLDWYRKIPTAHWQFLEATVPSFAQEGWVFVHAAVVPGLPLADQPEEVLFWQKIARPKPYLPGVTVVCGHTAQKNGLPADFGHTICIDTFAWGGQWLTCLDVHSGHYWQASQRGELRQGQRRGR